MLILAPVLSLCCKSIKSFLLCVFPHSLYYNTARKIHIGVLYSLFVLKSMTPIV